MRRTNFDPRLFTFLFVSLCLTFAPLTLAAEPREVFFAADKPERADRFPSSVDRPDTARVARAPEVYRPGLSELVSYEILMRLPENDRLVYLQRVREMLVELEDFNERGRRPRSASVGSQPGRLVADVDALIALFFPQSLAETGQVGGKWYECGAGYTPKLVSGGRGSKGPTVMCSSWTSTVGGAKELPGPPPGPPPVNGNGGNVSAPVGPAGAGGTGTGAGGAGTAGGAGAAGAATQPPAKYKPEDFDPSKSVVATEDGKDKAKPGEGYDAWVKQAGTVCSFTPKNKAACTDKKMKERNKEGGCFIGGVASTYGKSGFCEPVTSLCYDDSGKQMVNDKCKSVSGKDNKFSCEAGQTVCSVEIGSRADSDGNGKKKDSSGGAFCAPASGNGAKSASALCMDLASRYAKTENGGKSSKDLLAMAKNNAKVAKARWTALNDSLTKMCSDDKTTQANCEACQVMQYRKAQMRAELQKKTGGDAMKCKTDSEVEEYLNKCSTPEGCDGKGKEKKTLPPSQFA